MNEQHATFANFRRTMASLLTMTIALGPTVAPAFAAPTKPANQIRRRRTSHYSYADSAHGGDFQRKYFLRSLFRNLSRMRPNPQGEPTFIAAARHADRQRPQRDALLNSNPNLNPANGTGATNPFRLDRSQAATDDQDHDYTPEQQAFDTGLMDLFPFYTGTAGPPPSVASRIVNTNGLVMGYYDGNTVTALWNYAQHFAMSDNSYGTNFRPLDVGR